MCGAASTCLSLRMSQELSVGDVGTAAVGARLAPGLSVGGVGGRVLRVDAPSVRLTPELSEGEANGRAGGSSILFLGAIALFFTRRLFRINGPSRRRSRVDLRQRGRSGGVEQTGNKSVPLPSRGRSGVRRRRPTALFLE